MISQCLIFVVVVNCISRPQATMSNGQIKQFECSPEKFQELRYHVALVLRNMQSLGQHPTLIMNVEAAAK